MYVPEWRVHTILHLLAAYVHVNRCMYIMYQSGKYTLYYTCWHSSMYMYICARSGEYTTHAGIVACTMLIGACTYHSNNRLINSVGLIPNPKIHKRRSPLSTTPTIEESLPLATRPYDLPGHRSNGHSRVTSLTLSSSGEFLSFLVGSEKNLFTSIPLEEIERGLDLKGTEKGTCSLMNQPLYLYRRHETYIFISL